MKSSTSTSEPTNNLIVVSDLHCGSRIGLCAPDVVLDEGTMVSLNTGQRVMWQWWLEFWHDWVPLVTKRQRFDVVVNGDIVDGAPFNSTAQMSSNGSDQERIAMACMEPVCRLVKKVGGTLYVVRGTEAHVGKSATDEERTAHSIGAKPDRIGHYARWDLWKRVGEGLVHLLHHIGVTSSSAHEASAVNAELTGSYYESARTGDQPPDVIVRSHRHRAIKVDVPVQTRRHGIQFASAVTTPGWQLKTPFSWRIAGGRQSLPQIGGLLVRQGDRSLYTEFRVWSIDRSETD